MINTANITPLNVFLIWLAAVSLILFTYCALKLQKANKRISSTKNDEEKRWAELEEKAQNDYHEIIATANRKAQEILSEATRVNQDTTNSFQNSVDSMIENQKEELAKKSEEISKKHELEINELNHKIIILLTNVYKDIETSTREDIEKYKEAIRQQTFEAEKIAQDRMKEEYAKLEKEIEEQKQERMKKLEENIYRIINNISKEIIGKSLDLSSHEDLIVRSLDQAKKEGVL